MRDVGLHRRTVLARGAALIGAALLSGCDRLSNAPWFRRVLDKDEDANLYVQRLLLSPAKLAPEYPEAEISPWFKPNGTSAPPDQDYKALAAANFLEFRLRVEGLVENPGAFSLADLKAFPSRTQITRHDCVEGWSCIGKWTGVPLSALLQKAGLRPQARYVVFHCADTMDGSDAGASDDDTADADEPGGKASGDAAQPAAGKAKQAGTEQGDQASGDDGDEGSEGSEAKTGSHDAKQGSGTSDQGPARSSPAKYYESIDFADAFHPQTILAYEMNGKPLPVAHGAPLRLRVERQLGYKQAKYIMRIEVVDSLESIAQGKGGYWEDQGYEWYAGI